jgi:hypothetical protein
MGILGRIERITSPVDRDDLSSRQLHASPLINGSPDVSG